MSARDNARKITQLLTDGRGWADLFRTITAGPSGQRADFLVGRVSYREWGTYEFEIIDPTDGGRAGFARMDGGRWSITEEAYDGALIWRGWASSLSVGVDALIWGDHVATGRHDARRISGGWITKDRKSAMSRAA